jgi:hypothetical protein
MQVGDLVEYRDNSTNYKNHMIPQNIVQGVILEKIGKKWLKIMWSDGVILQEYIRDLNKISNGL